MSADSQAAGQAAHLTRVQKLAIVLVLLGADAAAAILKGLGEDEVQAVTAEMAKLTTIDADLQNEVLREFGEIAVEMTTEVRGGLNYAQAALEKAIGPAKASAVLGRVSPSAGTPPSIKRLLELEPRELFNAMKQEPPQTVALILSYFSPDKAAAVLSLMPGERRDQVIERLAMLAPTPIEVVEKVVEMILRRIGKREVRAASQTGGVKAAAALLNELEKDATGQVLSSLESRNPELGKAIREKMFTFEDIIVLDASTLQKLLRDVDMRDLATALKEASEGLKTKLLGCVSKRAAETLKEEMSFMGSVKHKEVEAAQQRLIEAVRKLESEGEVDLTEALRERQDAVVA